jgi:hypothetical protein
MKCWSCAEPYEGDSCPQCGAGEKPPKAEEPIIEKSVVDKPVEVKRSKKK